MKLHQTLRGHAIPYRGPAPTEPRPRRVCAVPGCNTVLANSTKDSVCGSHMNHPDADQYREKSAKKVTVGRKGGSVSEEEVAYIERRMAEGARPCVIARELRRHGTTVSRYMGLIREGAQLSSK